MVEKFEVGKSYKCIDVEAFKESDQPNVELLSKFFDKDSIIYVDGCMVYPSGLFGVNLFSRSDYLLVDESEQELFEEVVE